MTTAAHARYLEALGFTLVDADERKRREQITIVIDETSTSDVLAGQGETGQTVSRAGTRTTASRTSTKEILSPNAHKEWSSTDGEWERLLSGVARGNAPTSGGPHTLAGDVASIETETDLAAVWQRYKQSNQQAERDQLIVYYAPLVKFVASRIAAGLPQNVDQADLVSYGMFGLIDAITKFDLERGFKFETYAISRIKGAVLDELRSIDWVPRSVRAKAKSVERAMAKLESEFHRAPTDEEIAAELGMSDLQLTNIYNQISSLGLVALDEMLGGGGDSMTFGDTLADRRDGPGGVYERVEMRQTLADAVNRMGEREKIVLTLYYYESLTLAEIGRVLGVTESRVCQIHTKAVLQLRSKLSATEREGV